MENFDVIIIWWGPWWLKCAETLWNSGKKILLVEKNKEIWPKICAGWLTGKIVDYLKIPQSLFEFEYKEATLNINKSIFRIKNKDPFVWTIDRSALWQWQFSNLKKYSNIEIRLDNKLTEITEDYVIINWTKIWYKFLVWADGSTSIVKKHLKIEPKNILMAVQYIIPCNKYKKIEFFLNSRLFGSGYARIFPHKNYVSIWSGCDPKKMKFNTLLENFEKWIKSQNIDTSNAKIESFPIDCNYKWYKFKNIFLVWDAAWLASPITWEGIYSALISWEEVANMIINKTNSNKKIKNIVKLNQKHKLITEFYFKLWYFRTLFFYLWAILIQIPYLKKKALKLLW